MEEQTSEREIENLQESTSLVQRAALLILLSAVASLFVGAVVVELIR